MNPCQLFDQLRRIRLRATCRRAEWVADRLVAKQGMGDVAHAVLARQVVSRRESMAAAADDDDVVVAFRVRIAPLALPVLMVADGMPDEPEARVLFFPADHRSIVGQRSVAELPDCVMAGTQIGGPRSAARKWRGHCCPAVPKDASRRAASSERCAFDAPGLVEMRDNLPVVDYTRPHDTRAPIERCPTGAIVWLDPEAGPLKGAAAKKIIRTGPLPDAPT